MVFASMHSERHTSKGRARQNWGLLEEFLISLIMPHPACSLCPAPRVTEIRQAEKRCRVRANFWTDPQLSGALCSPAILVAAAISPQNIRGKAVALSSCFIRESRAGVWTGSHCPAVLHPDLLKSVWHWLLSRGTGNSTVLNMHSVAGVGLWEPRFVRATAPEAPYLPLAHLQHDGISATQETAQSEVWGGKRLS